MQRLFPPRFPFAQRTRVGLLLFTIPTTAYSKMTLGGLYYATLAFDYKSQKLQEKFDCFEYSAYLCYNNKRKESYMETKAKKIQVHTIDYKDIDNFFPAHSEITMSPLPKGHVTRLATINKVKVQ